MPAETPASPPLMTRACPLCGRDNRHAAALPVAPEPWRLIRCADCAMIYLENAPDYQALQTQFDWDQTFVEERNRRRERTSPLRYRVSDAFKRIKVALRRGPRAKERRFIARYVGPGRLLDVGCGEGRTLAFLPEGVTGFGIEISPGLARRAEAICSPQGGRVVRGDALHGLEQFEDAFFDGIMMRAYLEHEVRPREVLEAARRVLKPTGCVIIKTPNHASWNRRLQGNRWCGYRFPDHVNYYTPATLRRLAEAAGYTVRRFGPTDRIATSDNMWMVAQAP